jgi:hypothetical protein
LSSSKITDIDIIAIVHLRAIGIIIKSQNDDLVFTSNIIFDLLSSIYYPFYKGEALSKLKDISSPLNFLENVLDLLKRVRHDVIFNFLAANKRSFSEAVIQGVIAYGCIISIV